MIHKIKLTRMSGSEDNEGIDTRATQPEHQAVNDRSYLITNAPMLLVRKQLKDGSFAFGLIPKL